MAVNPNTNATMAGRVTAVSAAYPYASAKDETSPGAGDGTPYFLARADDIFGLQQALLTAAAIVPTGNADTVLASQYVQAIQELAAGRAIAYDESGAADVYVLDIRTGQQTPPAYFDGMLISFQPGNTNTGASTVNVATLGVKNVAGTGSAGTMVAGKTILARYDSGAGEFEILVNASVTDPAANILSASISGLVPSNGVDADHDITLGTGSALDSTGAAKLTLSGGLTKKLDVAWVAGSFSGGLFSGTVAADTTYHVFIIEKDSDGGIDAGFDTSLTAANIPAGYTAFRRVFSFITDSAANIFGFNAVESSGSALTAAYDLRILELNTSAPGTTGVALTITVPVDIEVNAQLQFDLADASSVQAIITSISQDDVAPSTTLADLRVNIVGQVNSTNMHRMTSQLGRIRYRSSLGSVLDSFRISLLGWTDFRR